MYQRVCLAAELPVSQWEARMARHRIDELVRILNRSFDDSSHSLLANLATVTELDRLRKAHWGETAPTLLLIDTMHEHDVYHAGEINKTRALMQDDDK